MRRWYRLTHAARITARNPGFPGERTRSPASRRSRRRSRLDGQRRDTLIELFNENLVLGMPLKGVDGARPAQDLPRGRAVHPRRPSSRSSRRSAHARGVMIEDRRAGAGGRAASGRLVAAWPDRDQERRVTSAWDLLRRLDPGPRASCAHGATCRGSISTTRFCVPISPRPQRCDPQYASARSTTSAAPTSAPISAAPTSAAPTSAAPPHLADITSAPPAAPQRHLVDADLSDADLSRPQRRQPRRHQPQRRRPQRRRPTSGTLSSNAPTSAAPTSAAPTSAAPDLGGADLSGAKGLTRRQLEIARNVDWDRRAARSARRVMVRAASATGSGA